MRGTWLGRLGTLLVLGTLAGAACGVEEEPVDGGEAGSDAAGHEGGADGPAEVPPDADPDGGEDGGNGDDAGPDGAGDAPDSVDAPEAEPEADGDDTLEAADDGSDAVALCSAEATTGVTPATVADLHDRLGAGEPLAVVDVREPTETARGVIEGALLYPWSSGVLSARHAELPADRPLFVICASGMRSAAASAFLAAQGHTCVHDVQGGMGAWLGAGYPTVEP